MNSKTKKAAILAVSVLFGLTLNSCKKCSKENKPEDRNGTASDTSNSTSTTDDGSGNQGGGSTGDKLKQRRNL